MPDAASTTGAMRYPSRMHSREGEEQSGELFRSEALDYHLRRAEQGEVLRLDPGWMRWCYRLVLAAVLFAGGYAVLGKVNEYASGPAVLRVVPASSRFEAVAVLAGHQRQHLWEGMPMRIELQGQRYVHQWVKIDRIGGEIIGPTEARRYLGPEVADTVEISGPCVLVHAELPTNTFRSRGVDYRYQDGMLATAKAPVRTERILFVLLPQLRRGSSP